MHLGVLRGKDQKKIKWPEKASPWQKPQRWATPNTAQRREINSSGHSEWLEVEGLEWNLLRGDQQLAEKFKTCPAAIESFFSR